MTKFAWMPLLALTSMNMLNYIDRYVITALLPNIQKDLGLSDGAGGMLGTAFMVVYFVVSPFFGWMGDRGKRPLWLAIGVGLWSLATAAAGFANSFVSLFIARASVGIGEAAYGTISPSLLADYFPPEKRGRIMAFFYVAIPVGGALGYLLGGVLGAHFGWRHAFLFVGAPGLFLAAWAAMLHDPPRGQYDAAKSHLKGSVRAVYLSLLRNRLYVCTVLGYTAYTFAIGGMSFWMPSYMMRERGAEQASGMMLFGGTTVVAGMLGTLIGGWLGDFLLKRSDKGYVWVNALSMLGAAGGTAAMLAMPDFNLFMVCLSFAQICAFMSTGPVNAIIINSVPAEARATAVAMSIFTIHLLGDSISPTLIGSLSDNSSLGNAMRIVPVVFVLAGAIWAVGLHKSISAAPAEA